jgi:hypothetical protein
VVTATAHDPTKLIEAARTWHDAGFCVIPSHEDGSKRPFGAWKQYQVERPEWAKLYAWLSSGRYTGIGCIMGQASGNAEMIELEGPASIVWSRFDKVIEEAKRAPELGREALLVRIMQGFLESSAGGGLHTIIRISDGQALGNTKLAHEGDKVVAETRGEGGFVIVYPTPARTGHDPQAAYVLETGGPGTVVTVTSEERDLIHDTFRFALDTGEPDRTPSPSTKPTPTASLALSPFDDYRARTTWREILEPAGWTYHSSDAEHDYWVRPGKHPRDGHSASTIEDGPFYLFSTSVEGIPSEVGLSKPQVYAYLHHDGDLAAATKSLRAGGYGDDTSAVTDLAPWVPDPSQPVSDTDLDDLRTQYVLANLPAVDWQQLWEDTTEEEWIVYPLLPARRLVALYSAPKVGKSLLMLELAAGIAAGRDLFGNPAQPPRTVLYVDFENDPKADIRERLQNMGYTPDDLTNLRLLSFPNMASLDSEKGSVELMAAVEVYGAQVVVIDTVSRAIAGDENENDTWLDFYRHTGLKLKQAQVSMVRLDHSGKDEAKGQRGGSAKGGDVDAVWRMTRVNDDLYDLICEMNRLPIDPESRHLTIERVEDDRLHHVVKGDKMRAKRDALDEAIADCGPYPEGQQGWKKVRAVVKSKHDVKASNHAWQAAVRRYLEGPSVGALPTFEVGPR